MFAFGKRGSFRAAKMVCGTVLLYLAFAQISAAQSGDVPLLTRLAQQVNQSDQVLFSQSKDWYVKCDHQFQSNSSKCELSTLLQPIDDAPNLGFSMTIAMANAGSSPVAIIRTPLDFHLAKGVELRIDDKLVGKLTFRSCHQNGCVVPFSMQGSVDARMRAGYSGSLEFYDLAGTKHVSKFSLLGISQALRTAQKFF